jgi:membrane-associated phospholipid phosphatase
MFDAFIESWIAPLRTPAGVQFFTFFTALGSPFVITVLCLLLGGFFCARRHRDYAYALVFAVLGSTFTSTFLKYYVARPRPSYALIPETTFSFPSGHAVVAISFFFFASVLLGRVLSRESQRLSRLVYFSGIFFAILIPFSRLYLGVHYVTDIIAGLSIGMLWTALALYFLDKKFFSAYPQKPV